MPLKRDQGYEAIEVLIVQLQAAILRHGGARTYRTHRGAAGGLYTTIYVGFDTAVTISCTDDASGSRANTSLVRST